MSFYFHLPFYVLQTNHNICPEIRDRAPRRISYPEDRAKDKTVLAKNSQVKDVWKLFREKTEGERGWITA
jgi:hypothetical protein